MVMMETFFFQVKTHGYNHPRPQNSVCFDFLLNIFKVVFFFLNNKMARDQRLQRLPASYFFGGLQPYLLKISRFFF